MLLSIHSKLVDSNEDSASNKFGAKSKIPQV